MVKVENLYTVFGIARSGNHAIIDWLYDHLEIDKCFFNNVQLGNPLKNRELYYSNDKKYFQTENVRQYYVNKYKDKENAEQLFQKRLEEFTKNSDWLVEDNLQLPEQCKNLIISKENFGLSESYIVKMHETEEEFANQINERKAIVILRHPANLLASRLYLIEKRKRTHGPRKREVDLESVLTLWKEYAKLYMSQSQLLGYNKTLYVTLEEWHESAGYRKYLLEQLSVSAEEKRINSVGLYGGGSSFQGVVRSADAAQDLLLNSRWLQLLEDDDSALAHTKGIFMSLLRQHPGVLKMAEKIYGEDISYDINQRLEKLD